MLTRRQVLRAGLVGGLGLVASRWLEHEALAADAKVKRVVLLWMNGGPSHIDTWDPKTGKTGGSHKAIKTSIPGVSIAEHLPTLAAAANKLAIVRGMTSKEGNHQRAQYLLRTGYAPSPTVQHPSLGGWMSKRKGDPATGLPAVVSIGGPSAGGGGIFGIEHGPFIVSTPGQMPTNVGYAPSVDEARFSARAKLLAGLEADFAARTGDPKVDGRRAVYDKAKNLMHASALEAFDVSKEPASVRARFGDTPFGRGCLTAARLVAAGTRFVEVTLDGWDTHKDNSERTKKLMSTLDPAMSGLIEELDRRALLDDTLVVWMGDFGRTPRINDNDGRDHHPAAWTAVLAGGGVRKGIVHGETDAEGGKVVKDAVTVPDLMATIAKLAGLDPADTVLSPAGRPISLTDNGTPVKALMA